MENKSFNDINFNLCTRKQGIGMYTNDVDGGSASAERRAAPPKLDSEQRDGS